MGKTFLSDLKGLPEDWLFKPYQAEGGVGGWAGSFDNTQGECVGFLSIDGKLVEWKDETDEVLRIIPQELH